MCAQLAVVAAQPVCDCTSVRCSGTVRLTCCGLRHGLLGLVLSVAMFL